MLWELYTEQLWQRVIPMAQRNISLNLVTRDGRDWESAFAQLSGLGLGLGETFAQVSVTCVVLSVEPVEEESPVVKEFCSEKTLQKVLTAIMTYVEDESDANDIINEMQNAGILFRERKS
jgi:hypothetical protein